MAQQEQKYLKPILSFSCVCNRSFIHSNNRKNITKSSLFTSSSRAERHNLGPMALKCAYCSDSKARQIFWLKWPQPKTYGQKKKSFFVCFLVHHIIHSFIWCSDTLKIISSNSLIFMLGLASTSFWLIWKWIC